MQEEPQPTHSPKPIERDIVLKDGEPFTRWTIIALHATLVQTCWSATSRQFSSANSFAKVTRMARSWLTPMSRQAQLSAFPRWSGRRSKCPAKSIAIRRSVKTCAPFTPTPGLSGPTSLRLPSTGFRPSWAVHPPPCHRRPGRRDP